MNKKLLISITMVLVLLGSIVLTAFAVSNNKSHHWAQNYIEKLEEAYNLQGLLQQENLDEAVSKKHFQSLVQNTINIEYQLKLETMTREEVVSEIVRLWAEETEVDLEEVMIPMVAVYTDTEEIDFKYQHNIMIAYFNDIAKGRGDAFFKPKEPVTYGEVIALLARISEDIIKTPKDKGYNDDTEDFKFEVFADYEILENEIIFNFGIANKETEAQEITFSSGQQYEIIITNLDDEEVYRYSDDKFFTMALIMKTIKADESMQWQESWDYTDKEGNLLTTGEFNVHIKILARNEAFEDKGLATTFEFAIK